MTHSLPEENRLMLFSGNANPWLATAVARRLNTSLGNATIGRFNDGEINIEVLDNVRGKDVFILQPTCRPGNRHLMELILVCDALRRASANRITAVIPYLGYSRQDRRVRSQRVPVAAKAIANMLTGAGINRVLTIDLHAEQIEGFFDIPVDNVYASPLLLGEIWRQKYPHPIVVSPDVGGVVRARAIAKHLEVDLAIIDKRRPQPGTAEVMNIIGAVDGKSCILIDDLIDTAFTICQAVTALKEKGAKKVVAYATHAVLSGSAIKNIEGSQLDALVVTDTIPLSQEAKNCKRIRVISVDGLLAETISRIHHEESISSLYMD